MPYTCSTCGKIHDTEVICDQPVVSQSDLEKRINDLENRIKQLEQGNDKIDRWIDEKMHEGVS